MSEIWHGEVSIFGLPYAMLRIPFPSLIQRYPFNRLRCFCLYNPALAGKCRRVRTALRGNFFGTILIAGFLRKPTVNWWKRSVGFRERMYSFRGPVPAYQSRMENFTSSVALPDPAGFLLWSGRGEGVGRVDSIRAPIDKIIYKSPCFENECRRTAAKTVYKIAN